MKEFELKYGCNPNQKPAKIFMRDGSDLPVRILNGRPGYINFLDAFNSWQLVKELREATGAGMMDCKKALTETAGDMEKAKALIEKVTGGNDFMEGLVATIKEKINKGDTAVFLIK